MNTIKKPKIEESWYNILKDEFELDYFASLKEFLLEEKKKYKIFPSGDKIFAAFNYTPFDKVKIVIIGQDPYHGYGQANGLCFSVNQGVKPPPSLQNIFKEINSDLGLNMSNSGDLSSWANQGVLLLNATLTVRENTAGAHQNKGWEQFTDSVITKLSAKREKIVFLLWGKYAQNKEYLIDKNKHYILKAAHPSPFSVERGFFGCKHFSKTNEILKNNNIKEIDWKL